MTKFEFLAPWPPSVNHYYIDRVIFTGEDKKKARNMKFVSPRGQEYRKQVESIILRTAARPMYKGLDLTGQLFMVTILYPPDRRIRDEDNYHKSLRDAIKLTKIIEDDSQIKMSFTVMMPFSGKENAGVKVSLERLKEGWENEYKL